MKVSVSLPDDDVAFLDAYVEAHALNSRSAVIHRAVESLRTQELVAEYEQAYAGWDASGDAAVWDTVTRDGLD